VSAHNSSLIAFDMNMANPIEVERNERGRGSTAK
jgi:hypothetical protein